MSLQSARLLVDRMKSDQAFRAQVLEEPVVENRFRTLRAAGFDCSQEDIEYLQTSFDHSEEGDDLVHTWQNPRGLVTPSAPRW